MGKLSSLQNYIKMNIQSPSSKNNKHGGYFNNTQESTNKKERKKKTGKFRK
uniref:Uncharacterized protein n=1 Tax=Rhizophora mucronata TaxID=61149 RepID=A0A2P2PDS8_RHIMU